MQISPRLFLSDSETTVFRIRVENLKKGGGTFLHATVEELFHPKTVSEGTTTPLEVPEPPKELHTRERLALELGPEDKGFLVKDLDLDVFLLWEGEVWQPAPPPTVVEAAQEEPTTPIKWSLKRMGPGDEFDLIASRPITGIHLLKVIAHGSPGILAAEIVIRPMTDEDRRIEREGAERAKKHRDGLKESRRGRGRRGRRR